MTLAVRLKIQPTHVRPLAGRGEPFGLNLHRVPDPLLTPSQAQAKNEFNPWKGWRCVLSWSFCYGHLRSTNTHEHRHGACGSRADVALISWFPPLLEQLPTSLRVVIFHGTWYGGSSRGRIFNRVLCPQSNLTFSRKNLCGPRLHVHPGHAWLSAAGRIQIPCLWARLVASEALFFFDNALLLRVLDHATYLPHYSTPVVSGMLIGSQGCQIFEKLRLLRCSLGPWSVTLRCLYCFIPQYHHI